VLTVADINGTNPNNVDEDYFLRENPEDINWQTEELAHHLQQANSEPLIVVRNILLHSYEGATQVFVMATRTAFLFANLSTAFDRMNLNIQDARIYNMAGNKCISTFMVLELDGTPLALNKQRLEEIQGVLHKYVVAPQALPGKQGTSPTRKQRHFTRNTVTTLTNPEGKPYSILEVLCPDRPGLLAVIAHIFVEMNINLLNAKITTLGENVEDVFFITDSKDRPLLDPTISNSLQDKIRQRLDAETKS
jgi:[protein-PII] uridylyltransferase